MSGGRIHATNGIYIQIKYRTFIRHDFYFTNQEAFGGVKSIIEAFVNNLYQYLKIFFFNI